MKLFVGLVLSLLVASSCSKSKNNSSRGPAVIEQIPDKTYDPDDFKPSPASADDAPELQTRFGRIMKDMILKCETDCVESVGFMGLAGEKGLSVCTGSLIGEDILLTNRHCVEEAQNTMGDPSNPSCAVKFPKMSEEMGEEVIFCEKVIKISDYKAKEGRSHRDYAIVKLKHKVKRKIYSLSRAGFPQGEAVKVVVVDPIPNDQKLEGKMVIKEGCTPIYNSVITSKYGAIDSPEVSTFDCTAMSGNSGSPVFGSDGKVKGVLWGSANFDAYKERFDAQPSLRKDFIYMTNFMCESWPGFDNPPANCATADERALENSHKIALQGKDIVGQEFQRLFEQSSDFDQNSFNDFQSVIRSNLTMASGFSATNLTFDQPTKATKLFPPGHPLLSKAKMHLKIECYSDVSLPSPLEMVVPTVMEYKISPRLDDKWRLLGFEVTEFAVARSDGFQLKSENGSTILGVNLNNVSGGTYKAITSIGVCR